LPKDNWQVIVISPSRKYVAELLPLISNEMADASLVELGGYPSTKNISDLPMNGSANLCFLDVSSDRQQAMTTIAALVGLKANLQIVVLVEEADPNLILQCLRQGAQEFLTRPFSQEQLQQVLEKLSRLHPSLSSERGRVTAIIPAKGACGATTLASNLAVHHKKISGGRVLLADLDPLTGTISFLLKLKSTYSFMDALQHASSLDADLWKGLVTQSQGVDVLLPPDNPVDSIHGLQSALPVIEFARRLYEHVITDVGSIYGDWTVSIAKAADEVLIVSTNELPALQATSRGLQYLEGAGVQKHKIKLVINRFNKEAGLTKEMIEMALHTDVYHLLPSDYETVQRALLDGKVIPTSTPFGKSALALSQNLLGKTGKEQDSPAKKSATSGVFSGSLTGIFKAFSRG
jgi:pilus assembly protein CpaE